MRPELFRGKAVLELGAGAGFSGLCLLRKARPSALQLTDYAPDVLQNLTHNLTISMPL
jgi:predicted nicotinamide N-methyase